MDFVRLAVIGCGRFCTSAILPVIRLAPARLQAVCDMDEGKAKTAAREFGAPRWYVNYRDMLATEQLDAVIVVVSPLVHPQLAIELMRHRLHVYVEKPPATTSEEATEMLRISRETGRLCAVGFMKRFATGYRMAKTLSQAPEFGPITFLEAKLTYGNFVPTWVDRLTLNAFLLDHSIHYLDLIQHLAGPVDRLSAEAVDRGAGRLALAVSLRFRSGAVGTLHLSSLESRGHPTERLHLVGVGQSVFVDNLLKVTHYRDAPLAGPDRVLDVERDAVHWEPNLTLPFVENSSHAHLGYAGEIRQFAHAILGGAERPPDIGDGLKAIRLAEAIERSRGQAVSLENGGEA